jgi:hypothetical protein
MSFCFGFEFVGVQSDEKRHDRLFVCAVWVRLLTPFVVLSFRFLKQLANIIKNYAVFE